MDIILATIVNCIVVTIAVLIHYVFLYRLTKLLPSIKIKHQFRIIAGIGGALLAHALEVWVFAISYFVVVNYFAWGTLQGEFNGQLLDFVYFSFTTYTSLGFGDIVPHGIIRFLVGIEALIGLVLITWTASFLFLEMQKNWDRD